LIECMTGTLPWAHLRGLQNLDRVRDMKLQYNNEKLVRGLPEEFQNWLEHIKSLRYESRPDYSYLHNLLLKLFGRHGGTGKTPYDWESDADVDDVSCIPETPESDGQPSPSPLRDSEETEEGSTEEPSSTTGRQSPRSQNANMNDGGAPDSSTSRRRGRCTIL